MLTKFGHVPLAKFKYTKHEPQDFNLSPEFTVESENFSEVVSVIPKHCGTYVLTDRICRLSTMKAQ